MTTLYKTKTIGSVVFLEVLIKKLGKRGNMGLHFHFLTIGKCEKETNRIDHISRQDKLPSILYISINDLINHVTRLYKVHHKLMPKHGQAKHKHKITQPPLDTNQLTSQTGFGELPAVRRDKSCVQSFFESDFKEYPEN